LSETDEEAIALMDALLNNLDDEAAGLAAVQVGYPRRIFLLRNGRNAAGEVENNAYINPVVLFKSKEVKKNGEACLSLPHMAGRFARPKSVTIKYMTIDGEFKQETFTGFWARAVMHEMDHLDGRLILEHVEREIAKRPQRTKFGMLITPHRLNVIAARRAKKKRARQAQKRARAIGR
jgi:peptide deformylase